MEDRRPDISLLTREELLAELALRVPNVGTDMDSIEDAVESLGSDLKSASMAAKLSELEVSETAEPKACPGCGRMVRVKARLRARKLQTLSGTHEFRRNYHYCGTCKSGWYPMDGQLGLLEHGELSAQLERRLLDFGIHDTFADAADRWSMHYPFSVSENLVRRVVERVGKRGARPGGTSGRVESPDRRAREVARGWRGREHAADSWTRPVA